MSRACSDERPRGIDLPHVLTGADLRKLANGESVGLNGAIPAWAKLGLEMFGSLIDRHATPERIRRLADWWLPIGHRVVVICADLAGIELAEFLAKRGRDVCILTVHEQIAPEIGPKRRLEHERRLERLKVAINTCTKVARISATGVEIRLVSGKKGFTVTAQPFCGDRLAAFFKLCGKPTQLFSCKAPRRFLQTLLIRGQLEVHACRPMSV
jgi:NADPH-dependent 2,4-dienoyl-CoA reductase/sulfur reductase-like enzyme